MATRDIKEFLIRRIEQLRGMDDSERDLSISDIIDDLLSSRVRVTQRVSTDNRGPVPAYNRETDGDYSAWLATNNID